jgi:uncharacterized protein YrzB (UPF0473 family)
MEEKTFTVIDEEGVAKEFEVVLTFKSEDFGKSYVIYKNPYEENDEVFAANFDEDAKNGGNLVQVETEEEWNMLEEVLESFLDDEEE